MGSWDMNFNEIINNELEIIFKKLEKSNEGNRIIEIEMSKTDKEINKVMDNILSSGKIDIITISNDVGWLLIGFGFNMATYSLRTGNQRYFNNGLAAIGIASKIVDLRECLRLLSLYWDVHKKKGLDFEFIISKNMYFSRIIKDFIDREEKNKSLECMEYFISGNGNNIQYEVLIKQT